MQVMRWSDVISDEDLWKCTHRDKIKQQISKKKMERDRPRAEKTAKQDNSTSIVFGTPKKRRRRRPKTNWRRSCEQELRTRNMTGNNAKQVAKDGEEWRKFVDALCLMEGLRG